MGTGAAFSVRSHMGTAPAFAVHRNGAQCRVNATNHTGLINPVCFVGFKAVARATALAVLAYAAFFKGAAFGAAFAFAFAFRLATSSRRASICIRAESSSPSDSARASA